MPGAELTEVVDDRTWKGKVHVKFGPVQMAFAGTVVMEERDDSTHRAKLAAKGTEQRGKGVASAKVESWLEPAGDAGTTVHIRSDLTITGAAAQLSRGLLPEVSKLLTKQFAECLEAKLNERTGRRAGRDRWVTRRPKPTRPPRRHPQAVGGFGLGLRALWAAIARFVARLFGRRDPGRDLRDRLGGRRGPPIRLHQAGRSLPWPAACPARDRCARVGRDRRDRCRHRPRMPIAVEAALALPPQGRFVRNADHATGQSSSLAVGLHDLAADSEGAVVLLADQPGVTDAEVRALIDAFERSTEPHRADRLHGRSRAGPALSRRSTPRPATCTATSALARSWPRIPTGWTRSWSPSRPPPTSTARRTCRATDQPRRRRTIVRSLGCSNPNRA